MCFRSLVLWLSLPLLCLPYQFVSEAQTAFPHEDSTQLIHPLSFPADVSVEAVIDSPRVPLNRNLILTIQVRCTGDINQYEFQWPGPPDIDRFEIVGSSSANIVKDQRGQLVNIKEFRYVLKPVGEGHGRIGPVTLFYTDRVTQKEYSLNTRPMGVDITEPVAERSQGFSTLLLLLIGLTGVLFGGVVLIYVRKRKGRKKEMAPPIETVSPEEIALEELDMVPELRLAGELKEYYSAISSVFRRYIDRTYSLRTSELTTHDIVSNLKLHEVAEDTLMEIEKILNMCDMVKFARQEPASSDLDRIFSMAQDFFTSRAQVSARDMREEGEDDTES